MSIADYTLILAYFAAIFLIGALSSRYIKNETDFLLAGRRVGLVFLTFTLAATHFGGGFIMGGIEHGMEHGISGIWYGLACGVGLLILSTVAPRLRKLSLFTAPECLEDRYNSRFVKIYATATSLLALIGILSAQIIAIQRLLSLFDISPVIGSVVATMIFILYTYLGGMWAVTITDFFQLSIAAVCLVVISILSFDPSSFSTPGFGDPFSRGFSSIAVIVLPTFMYTLIGQDFYQRLFSAKDEKIARRGSIIGGLLLCVLSVFPVLLGMSLGVRYAGFDESMIFFSGVPFGMLFIVAVFGGIMSTSDSLLSAASSHIVKDILEDILKVRGRGLLYSRFSVIGIGLFALALSFFFPTIIDALVFSYTIYTAAIFFPLVLGIFWKGGNREGAISSMILSSILVILGVFFNPFDVPLELLGALFSLIVYVVFSLIYGGYRV